jgi:FixJ family two-component response regulator
MAVVHVVDDDAEFRAAIGRLLQACGYTVVLHESGEDLLEHLPDPGVPGCIILDVRIPGLSGPELQDRLRASDSTLSIVFLTGYGDIQTTVRAMRAGAEDFLTKPVTKRKLLEAVERAISRSRASCKQLDRLNALRALLSALTPREREVFDLVVRGKMNKQIAHEIGTTERTVKAHRQKVMEKTRVQSLAELVSVAERLGMLSATAALPGTTGEPIPRKPPTVT